MIKRLEARISHFFTISDILMKLTLAKMPRSRDLEIVCGRQMDRLITNVLYPLHMQTEL